MLSEEIQSTSPPMGKLRIYAIVLRSEQVSIYPKIRRNNTRGLSKPQISALPNIHKICVGISQSVFYDTPNLGCAIFEY